MKKKLFILSFFVLLLSFPVLAHGEEEIEQGRELVESKVSSDELSDEQLEAIGEYYMELMHPGSLHDAMHEMMGLEEGTEAHETFHISLAQRMYCGEYSSTSGMMGSGSMGYGMMGMMYGSGPWNYSFWSVWNLAYIVFIALIFALIFWAVFLLVKKEAKRK